MPVHRVSVSRVPAEVVRSVPRLLHPEHGQFRFLSGCSITGRQRTRLRSAVSVMKTELCCSNPVEPGRKRTFAVEVRQVAECLHESVLRQFFSVFRRSHHPDNQRKDLLSVGVEEIRKAFCISGQNRCNNM